MFHIFDTLWVHRLLVVGTHFLDLFSWIIFVAVNDLKAMASSLNHEWWSEMEQSLLLFQQLLNHQLELTVTCHCSLVVILQPKQGELAVQTCEWASLSCSVRSFLLLFEVDAIILKPWMLLCNGDWTPRSAQKEHSMLLFQQLLHHQLELAAILQPDQGELVDRKEEVFCRSMPWVPTEESSLQLASSYRGLDSCRGSWLNMNGIIRIGNGPW